MSDWSRVRFRAWLVKKVLASQHLGRVCCVAIYTKRTAVVADKLGLSPSVVEEVGRRYAEIVTAAGRPVPTGPKTNSDYAQLRCWMPPEVREAWCDLSERLHMKPSMALRTLVHEYLLDHREPLHRDERWVLDGKVYSDGPKSVRVEPGITTGAKMALHSRADKIGLSVASLVRCLVVDALAGRRRIGAPIQRSAMYDDPNRYVL